jgi:hypothetical protein
MSDEWSPEELLWDLMRGALTARALGIVADLRVADALAAGPRPVGELAAEVQADTDTLYRLLRALASDDIFAETEPSVFANTSASELLRGGGWADYAHLYGGVFHRTAAELGASGEQAFTRLFGTDFWSWLAEHPAERASFDRAMAGGKEWKLERLAHVDWRDGETVVDVGGGNGMLLAELFERRAGLRGIVFDLAETDRDESSFPNGIEFVAGSFFERVPPGDTYLLSSILSEWGDSQARAILETIRNSAPPGARVLIAEAVITPGNEAIGQKWVDLLMLAIGGRERDEAEWRTLLHKASLEPVSIADGLIEARCP